MNKKEAILGNFFRTPSGFWIIVKEPWYINFRVNKKYEVRMTKYFLRWNRI
jgi:hypothetical protein